MCCVVYSGMTHTLQAAVQMMIMLLPAEHARLHGDSQGFCGMHVCTVGTSVLQFAGWLEDCKLLAAKSISKQFYC